MSKDAYFFKHDCNARNDEKLLEVRRRYGMEGYGIYWAIIEKMREASGYTLTQDYGAIAWDLRCKESMVKSIVEDFGLFSTEEGLIASHRLMEDMAKWDRKRQAYVEGGRKGMATRWAKKEDGKDGDSKEAEQAEPQMQEELVLSGSDTETSAAKRKTSRKKYSEEQTELHSQCKTIFDEIYQKYKGSKFTWSAKEMAGLVAIIKSIQFQMVSQNLDTAPSVVGDNFSAFIERIYQRSDDWTKRNATPSLIASKFNEIYTYIKNNTHNGNKQSDASAGNARDKADYLASIFADLQSGANQ